MPLPEVAARLRLFAHLVAVTGSQTDVLSLPKSFDRRSSEVNLWVR